jgi:DICT domain-containing protein
MLPGSILQRLEIAHQGGETGKRRLGFGVYYKNTLVSLCHALEDCILAEAGNPLVIAAFQSGKWYLEEADRYAQIAAQSAQVVILANPTAGFREHSTSQRQNVALVALDETDPVAQEWHLIIFSPGYSAMVLCQELSLADYGGEQPESDQLRKFYGLWTFDRALVQEAVALGIAHIDSYNPDLAQQLQLQAALIQSQIPGADPISLYGVVARVVDYLQANHQDLLPDPGAKPLKRNLLSNEIQAFTRIAELIDLADAQNPQAAAEVTGLVEMFAEILDLPGWQVQRLRLASMLHRLAPLQPDLVPLTAAPCCALLPGVQTLRKMPQLRAIAQIIAHQTEWWNGSGQPAGQAGDQIPLESRILGLVADFQQRAPTLKIPQTINDGQVDEWQESLDLALEQTLKLAGDRWDPKLAEVLGIIVHGLQQGLSLPFQPPRLVHGLWLLDPEEIRIATHLSPSPP